MKTGVVSSYQFKAPWLSANSKIEGDYYAKRLAFSTALREFNAATRELPRSGKNAVEWTALVVPFATWCATELHIPQVELAKHIGVHKTTVCGWIKAHKTAQRDKRRKA